MAKDQFVTLGSLVKLISAPGVYQLLYSFNLGMSTWVTFFGGFIALAALPRHQFGALQHKTFPVYFTASLTSSVALLGLWTSGHPDVLKHIWQPSVADVAQAYALGFSALTQAANLFVVGPMTGRTMQERNRQEKLEGKTYNDPNASDKMKGLNKTFGMLHGISSLLNLGSVLALGFHGLWIGNAGITSN